LGDLPLLLPLPYEQFESQPQIQLDQLDRPLALWR
jgi:hypothetical protein